MLKMSTQNRLLYFEGGKGVSWKMRAETDGVTVHHGVLNVQGVHVVSLKQINM